MVAIRIQPDVTLSAIGGTSALETAYA